MRPACTASIPEENFSESNISEPINPETIAAQLRSRLLALDFPAFARCICCLMEAIGYEDANLTGRREWKGYNRPGGGGYDIEAALPGGNAPRPVVAQIKQYDALTVHQRSVDELRGACLRAGAVEGLLVTTSVFSEVVRNAAVLPNAAAPLIAPIRLIDGEELVSLLIRHRLGVKERDLKERDLIGKQGFDEQGFGGLRFLATRKRLVHTRVNKSVKKLEIDEAFFRSIAAPSIVGPSIASPSLPRSPQRRGSAVPRWRVTVQISSGQSSSGNVRPKGGC